MKYLTAILVCKNEEPYLREWFEYHMLMGVERFIVFNNNSSDGSEDILKEYQDHKIIQYYNMSDVPVQFKAYNHALKTHGHETRWMMFTDTDEFPITRSRRPLTEELIGFEKHPGVALHWLFFGSSGLKKKLPGLVIERFTRSAKGPDRHVKSIVDPRRTISVGRDPHTFYYKKGFAVDELHRKLDKNYALSPPTAKNLWLNHYSVKSEEEFYERRTKNLNAGDGKPYQNSPEAFRAQDRSEEFNPCALYYAEKVSKNIERRQNEQVRS